jgi:hypothetical protein
VFEGIASAFVAWAVLSILTGAVGATGGAALAVALALLAAYGLYQLYEEAKAIAEMWDKCPDERDYRLGKLIGLTVGALLGGKAIKGLGGGGGAGGRGGGGGRGGSCPTCKSGEACFIAGTLVKTATGEKPIEEVQPGDVVLSFDPERRNASSEQLERQSVTRSFVRTAPVVLDIHVGTETITATPEHPFWVIVAGWTAAGELRRGSALLTKDGVIVHIDYVVKREGAFNVYNFEVGNSHTYYVSNLGILVHNQCGPGNPGGPGPGGGGPGKPFNPDQDALIQLAKDAQRRGGVNQRDAQTLLDWANEYGLRNRNDIGTNHWVGGDHIHIGPVNHLPVK